MVGLCWSWEVPDPLLSQLFLMCPQFLHGFSSPLVPLNSVIPPAQCVLFWAISKGNVFGMLDTHSASNQMSIVLTFLLKAFPIVIYVCAAGHTSHTWFVLG